MMLHTHEVEGSSPPVSTNIKQVTSNDVTCLMFLRDQGLEPIEMQVSGGHLPATGWTAAAP